MSEYKSRCGPLWTSIGLRADAWNWFHFGWGLADDLLLWGAYNVMAYVVMAYVVMAYNVMAYVVMAYVVMAYVVMAYVVMAHVVMANVVGI